MFPATRTFCAQPQRFPRIRGDVPGSTNGQVRTIKFSPHTRGCSFAELVGPGEITVFPAYAGMFLPCTQPQAARRSFPRIRGDVPSVEAGAGTEYLFSPHTRGCSHSPPNIVNQKSVFPAYAGMFLIHTNPPLSNPSFPRIRGDVPAGKHSKTATTAFSPHTRGCSCGHGHEPLHSIVFPAYAGMFRLRPARRSLKRRFPRIRGDVPGRGIITPISSTFSPHTRGCSLLPPHSSLQGRVFPAYAGMFPLSNT